MGALYTFVFGLATTLGMLIVFVAVQRVVAPQHAFRGEGDAIKNRARALLHVGNVLGIFIIAGAVAAGGAQGDGWKNDAKWVAAFGVAALALFAISSRLGARVLLRSRLPSELERGNVAAGIAAGAHSVATAIIVSKAISGNDLNTLGISAVFFVLAQISLHVLVSMFRFLTSYDDSEEIIGENVAAALSYAGVTIAIALIVGRAVEGTFLGWIPSLKGFGLALLYGLMLYPVRQIVVQGLLLGAPPSLHAGKLDHAIARERNVGMGALEAIAYLATALVIGRLG